MSPKLLKKERKMERLCIVTDIPEIVLLSEKLPLSSDVYEIEKIESN